MQDRYLKKKDIAERFNCSWQKAARVLEQNGLLPVDYGPGKGNGPRWLESAVNATLLAIHEKAQRKAEKAKPPKIAAPRISLLTMSNAEIFNMITVKDPARQVADKPPVQ